MTTDHTRGPRSAADAPANHQLAQALAEVHAGGQRRDVYRVLLPGSVLVPITAADQDQAGMPSLLAVQSPDGRSVLLGFSSVEALRGWSDRVRSFIVMSGIELVHQACALATESVVLDACSDHAMHLASFELEQLADGLAPVGPGEVRSQLTHATRRIRPSQVRWPQAARVAVRAAADQNEVEQAYLFDIAYHDGQFQPAVGLRFRLKEATGTIDPVMTRLASELQQNLPTDIRVDLVVLDDNLYEAVRHIVSPMV